MDFNILESGRVINTTPPKGNDFSAAIGRIPDFPNFRRAKHTIPFKFTGQFKSTFMETEPFMLGVESMADRGHVFWSTAAA